MSVRVQMTMTDQDVKNTTRLMDILKKSSKAETVRTALKLATDLSEIIGRDDEVIVKHKNGSTQQLTIQGING